MSNFKELNEQKYVIILHLFYDLTDRGSTASHWLAESTNSGSTEMFQKIIYNVSGAVYLICPQSMLNERSLLSFVLVGRVIGG